MFRQLFCLALAAMVQGCSGAPKTVAAATGGVIPNRLVARDIISVIEAQSHTVQTCIRTARENGELKNGRHRLLLDFVIRADGHVEEARMHGVDYVGASTMPTCFSERMIKWRFPPSQHNTPIANFPFGPIEVEGQTTAGWEPFDSSRHAFSVELPQAPRFEEDVVDGVLVSTYMVDAGKDAYLIQIVPLVSTKLQKLGAQELLSAVRDETKLRSKAELFEDRAQDSGSHSGRVIGLSLPGGIIYRSHLVLAHGYLYQVIFATEASRHDANFARMMRSFHIHDERPKPSLEDTL